MRYFYVAGKWQEKDRIRVIMNYLVECGHAISYDWTQHKSGDDNYYCACQDKNGVIACDALIAIVDKQYDYRGVYVEIGMALALNRPVYILGDYIDSCVFASLCKKISNLSEIVK